MTENEIIEILQTEKACVTRAMKNECNRDCYNCDLCEEGKDILTVYDSVINALDEIQQYRAICTIEEFKRAKEMEAVYGQVKWERDIAISQLEEIGVALGQKMEEFKALKEKNETLKTLYEDARKEGNNLLARERNKAIDEFAETLKEKYEEHNFGLCLRQNDYYSYSNSCMLFENYIDKIAEQLKAGGKNE